MVVGGTLVVLVAGAVVVTRTVVVVAAGVVVTEASVPVVAGAGPGVEQAAISTAKTKPPRLKRMMDLMAERGVDLEAVTDCLEDRSAR